MKQNEYGRSMIEMLGVLAIIGVLSVGGIAGFSKAMAKYRLNKFVNQISMISHNITTLYASQKNYEGVTTETEEGMGIILRAKLVPEEMMELDNEGKLTSIVSPYGTQVVIRYVDRRHGNDNQAYYISTWNIPLDACIELATYDWSQNSSVILVSVGYEATGPLPAGNDVSGVTAGEGCPGLEGVNPLIGCTNGSVRSLPLSVVDATAACEADTDIAIKFR